MSGGKAARGSTRTWPTSSPRKAVEFIERQQDEPFFLYFALARSHVPARARTRGSPARRRSARAATSSSSSTGASAKSSARSTGSKLADNTLVIFTSDNGPVLDDGYAGRGGGEARRPQARRAVPRRQVQPLRRRHARAVHRPLAGAGQARRRPMRWSARSTSSRPSRRS